MGHGCEILVRRLPLALYSCVSLLVIDLRWDVLFFERNNEYRDVRFYGEGGLGNRRRVFGRTDRGGRHVFSSHMSCFLVLIVRV